MRWALVVLLLGCGNASTEPDASGVTDAVWDAAHHDAARADAGGLADAEVPDAQPARMAAVVDCNSVVGTGMGGHTAEITDTKGYVPSGNATMSVGYFALFAYADGGNGVTHSIVSGSGGVPDGLFDSDPVSNHGDRICIQFDAPGQYPYYCGQHPNDEIGLFTVVSP